MNFPSIDGDRDRDDTYAWVREESRDALRQFNEMQRYTGCTHSYGPRGVCRGCGDDEPRKDAHA